MAFGGGGGWARRATRCSRDPSPDLLYVVSSKKIKKVESVLFMQLLDMGGWARKGTRCSSPKGCDIFATVCLLYPTKNYLWISQNKY